MLSVLTGLFKNLDSDTITLLTRFAMRGVKSGNLNEYIKGHLRRVMDAEDNPPTPPVSQRVVNMKPIR